MTRYLNIRHTDGYMYSTSKEKKEGYTESISKSGKVSYQRNERAFEGTFVGIKLDDTDYGKQLRIKFKTAEDFIVVNVAMKDSKGSLNKYFKAFVKVMANLDKNKKYSFGTNTTKKNPKGYLYESFYINNLEENTPVMWAIKNEDVPQPVLEKDPLGGAEKWNYKPEDIYYFGVFEKEYTRLEDNEPKSFQGFVTDKGAEKEEPIPFGVDADTDDLPF